LGDKCGEGIWFTTFAPRPGEARALAVEIDPNDEGLEFVESLTYGDWYIYRGAIPPDQIDFNGL